ncbi:MAG: DUF1501 domain-containing protein [Isosphaeraceae bacterium]
MDSTRGPSLTSDVRISRRGWLKVGGLTLGGMALPEILRAEAANAGTGRAAKGVIVVVLPGGPSHLDMYDLKPDAPAEVRGEFQPIATRVPGVEICEALPKLANMTDRITLIRSLVGFLDDHNTHWCTTGWESHPPMDSSPIVPGYPEGDWPSLGAILSKRFGPRTRGVPPSIDLTPNDADARFILRTPTGQPGYLGKAHAAFEVASIDQGDLSLPGLGQNRLSNRRALLAGFEEFRRHLDRHPATEGMDEFQRQAFDVLTSPRLAEALDLDREDATTRRRYGLDQDYPSERDGKTYLAQFLMARRLIEAGARCVTLAFSRSPFGRMLKGDYNWDWHKDLFNEARGTLPLFDVGLSALIGDLEDRGLLDDTLVVCWGEFGRTPKINKDAGRDHWAKVGGALLAGGGLRHGQVIGSTTRLGEEPRTRPVHFREVFASLYQRLGIDTEHTRFNDLSGRPHSLVGHHRPMPELLG